MKKRDRKPNLPQFMKAKVGSIRKAFTVPVHVTIIVRHPTNTECEMVVSDDPSLAAVLDVITRRHGQLAPLGGATP